MMKVPRILHFLPVLVLAGPARFSWWTLYPHSSYWRRGGHEPEIAAAIASLGDVNGRTAWDMGAHFGIHSVGFARQVGPRGQVVAFEPDPVSFKRLQLHLRLNRLKNVIPLLAAASDCTEEQTLVVNQGSGATTSHLPYPGEQLDSASCTLRIHCLRADDLVASGKIRVPDVIKLDVEGHGGEALAGARVAIQARKPVIVASMHSPQEVAAIRTVLEPLGYVCQPASSTASEGAGWSAVQCGGNYILRYGVNCSM